MSKYSEILKLSDKFVLLVEAQTSKNKENKLLTDYLIRSDPEKLERHNQKNRERQKRYFENHKNDPNFIEKTKRNSQNQWSEMKNIINNKDSTTGLLIKLRRQIAEYKHHIVRTNKPQELIDAFIDQANKIYQFIEAVKLYTLDTRVDLVSLISYCEQIKNNPTSAPTVNNTLNEIHNKLNKDFDNKVAV